MISPPCVLSLTEAKFPAIIAPMSRPGPKVKTGKKAWLDARRRNIELADAQLGNLDERCHWLLDEFMTRDPDAILPSERAVWRDKLMALVLGARPGAGYRLLDLFENDPLEEEIRGLWERVVALTDAHRASVKLPQLEVWFGRHPETADGAPVRTPYVRMGRGYRAGDFQTALLWTVVDLLSACQKLRECPECHHLFVARRRQERHAKCARKYWDRNRPSRRKGGK